MKTSLRYRVSELLSSDISTSSEAQLLFRFRDVYHQLFGEEPCISCPGKLAFSVKQLSRWYDANKTNTQMDNRKFILKDGVLIYRPKEHTHYSNANLTDEAAVRILSTSPGQIKNFKTFPEDWEELVEAYTPEEVNTDGIEAGTLADEELRKLTVKELKAKCKEMGLSGYSKLKEDELISMIQDASKEEE